MLSFINSNLKQRLILACVSLVVNGSDERLTHFQFAVGFPSLFLSLIQKM